MSEAEKDTREWTLIYCPDCGKHLDVTDDWRICPQTHFRHRRASETVVPKFALTAALEERDEAKQIIANFTACLEEDPRYVAMRDKAKMAEKEREKAQRSRLRHKAHAERAEAALAEALDVIEAVVAGIVTLDGARVVLRKHGRLP